MEYQKLPEDFKAIWLMALRSGDYKQGKGLLYYPGDKTYCCLGVAGCVLGIPLNQLIGRGGLTSLKIQYNVPEAISYCHDDANPFVNKTATSKLMSMNDYEGRSFNDIADWIEQNL